MDRLVIISKSKEDGSSFAALKLGLSEPQFIVITNLKEAEELPDRIITIFDDKLPDDSIKIGKYLSSKTSICLREYAFCKAVLEKIKESFDTVNGLFTGLYNEQSTNQAKAKLKAALDWRGLTEANGYTYDIGRLRDGNFFIHPTSDLMRIIYNLYRAYLLRLNATKDIAKSI